ncbi:hypothetical protein JTB14_012980 [Gonioctena quinquepunctata]|nr:hypothetical protein JTB14_012980 [Gonioctena quinquepunctata]
MNNKWLFKTKPNADGNIIRYKARLVIKGWVQKKGIDYEGTYFPVVTYTSIPFFMALGAKFDFEIERKGAVTAFLHRNLKEGIYILQPKFFHDRSQQVCLLNEYSYDLKQASGIWNMELDSELKEFGLTQSCVDSCIHFDTHSDEYLIVPLHVDNFMIFPNDDKMRDDLKKKCIPNLQNERFRKGTICTWNANFTRSSAEYSFN